jgi:phage shock protein A
MGIFDRFSALLKSNINDLISRAEDPEKMLTQILVDMRGQLVKAKQQVASAIADEKRLRDQTDAEYKQAQDWERRAMLAVQEGRDDMAKQAIVRHGEHTTHGQQL